MMTPVSNLLTAAAAAALIMSNTVVESSMTTTTTVESRNSTFSTLYLRATKEEEEEDPGVRKLRKLVGGEVDPLVLERYNKIPEGFRKHPSYYSETNLRRARTYNDDEKKELTSRRGEWTFVDKEFDSRPGDNFYNKYPNRDVPYKDFKGNAWQKNKDYLSKFVPEALALTQRALEAILSEYGLGKEHKKGISFEERSAPFQPALGENGVIPRDEQGGGGKMPKASFEGLKRRVLHAIMAQDRFTIAMGGHSAAAGTSCSIFVVVVASPPTHCFVRTHTHTHTHTSTLFASFILLQNFFFTCTHLHKST